MPDVDHPELASTLAKTRAGLIDPELEMTSALTVWGRTIQGRRLYVVLTQVSALIGETEDDDGDGVIQDWEQAWPFEQLGCGVWDFDAETPVDPAAMTAWVGAEPVQLVDAPGLISGGTWSVYKKMPGTGEVHMGFIPEAGRDEIGFSGVSITMSSAPKEREARAAPPPLDEADGGERDAE